MQKSVTATIQEINARLIALATKTPKDIPAEEKTAIMELSKWFYDNYDTEEVWKEINSNLPVTPLFLRMASVFEEEECSNKIRGYYEKLNDTQKKNVDTLYNFIWNNRADRKITVSNEVYSGFWYQIKRTIPRNLIAEESRFMKDVLAFFASYAGGLILRVSRGKMFDIYGFMSTDDAITCISEDHLYECCNTVNEKPIEAPANERYKCANLEFVK